MMSLGGQTAPHQGASAGQGSVRASSRRAPLRHVLRSGGGSAAVAAGPGFGRDNFGPSIHSWICSCREKHPNRRSRAVFGASAGTLTYVPPAGRNAPLAGFENRRSLTGTVSLNLTLSASIERL